MHEEDQEDVYNDVYKENAVFFSFYQVPNPACFVRNTAQIAGDLKK